MHAEAGCALLSPSGVCVNAYVRDAIDFTYVNSNFRADTQPVHNERQIVKVVGPVLEKREAYELPPDIDQHGFSKFSNIYFKVGVAALFSLFLLSVEIILSSVCLYFSLVAV